VAHQFSVFFSPGTQLVVTACSPSVFTISLLILSVSSCWLRTHTEFTVLLEHVQQSTYRDVIQAVLAEVFGVAFELTEG
jgi:hypothetical protein